MRIEEMRSRVLSAREARASLRQRLSGSATGSLSLSLNVPGYPKSLPALSAFFDDVLDDCRTFLQAHRIRTDAARAVRRTDEAGDFYLVPLTDPRPLRELKTLTESFEANHALGRFIDIDILDVGLRPVSSGALKACFLCGRPALDCMREGRHTHEALRGHLIGRVRGYREERARRRACRRLSELALKAVLYEISVSPKPGLVGRFEQGAHEDMDYFTFLASTAALAGHFEELARAGCAFRGPDPRAALPVIRTIGLKMEAGMFEATRGVNTQKGLVFLLGLALFSAARCIESDGAFTSARCREIVSSICAGLVENELAAGTYGDATHGATCFARYGRQAGGARKEAEEGLPSVFEHGLPELRSALDGAGGAPAAGPTRRALLRTLLRLMAAACDTNILYRGDMETLRTVRRMARRVLDAGDEAEAAVRYEELLGFCGRENVSPGGSADLLAVSVFLYFAERAFAPGAARGDPA